MWRMLSYPLCDKLMQRRLIHLRQVDSTNRYLRELPPIGEGMTVVVTDYQTAGKGQGLNTWESEKGMNLLMSVLVKPISLPPRQQFVLSEAGALAVGVALSSYTEGIVLKWPNDIYWHDRKISGTLIETAIGSNALRHCIWGIGVNVNQRMFRSDAPNPVSLCQIIGHETPVDEVMTRILDALETELNVLSDGNADSVRNRYHQWLYRREGFHAYRDAEGDFRAEILRVEDDGHLILRDVHGRERSYAFKEVEQII